MENLGGALTMLALPRVAERVMGGRGGAGEQVARTEPRLLTEGNKAGEYIGPERQLSGGQARFYADGRGGRGQINSIGSQGPIELGLRPGDFGLEIIADNSSLHSMWEAAMRDAMNTGKENAFTR